jgi:hypothetical protein
VAVIVGAKAAAKTTLLPKSSPMTLEHLLLLLTLVGLVVAAFGIYLAHMDTLELLEFLTRTVEHLQTPNSF